MRNYILRERWLTPTLIHRQILERSGVGNGELLKKLDIKVVSDLPGVGYVSSLCGLYQSSQLIASVNVDSEQYQDHYTTLSSASSMLIDLSLTTDFVI